MQRANPGRKDLINFDYLKTSQLKTKSIMTQLKQIIEKQKTNPKVAYAKLDQDNDQKLSREDLKESLQQFKISCTDEDIDQIFYVLDTNRNNYLSYQEFVNGLNLQP